MTLAGHHSRWVLAWWVDYERGESLLQAMISEALQTKFYQLEPPFVFQFPAS